MEGPDYAIDGALLRVIADRLPAMLAYWDADQRCRFANRAYERWFGVDADSMPGRSMADLLGPLYALNLPYIEGALRGEEQEFEREIPDPAGGPPRHSQALYVPDVIDGVVRGFCVLVVDVSRRKQAEEALRETRERLATAERVTALATLAAGIGHEINNPLATVLGNLEVALAATDGVEGASTLGSALADARDASLRIRSIVQGMQLLARDEKTATAPLALHQVIEQSIALSSHAVRYRARVDTELDRSITVEGGAGQLVQVFVNLLVNAAQAMSEGQVATNRIGVASRREGTRAIVEISDNGCGIPVPLLGRIFEPFFTTRPVGEGTGLGLAISKTIVERHGGTLTASSAVESGSVFRMELPLLVAASPPSNVTSRPTERASTERAGGERAHVVIVDDNVSFARTLERLLADCDVTVFAAGREALAYLLGVRRRVDLVVCDLTMPEVTGADVHATLARQRPDLAARFVIMTGGPFTETGRRFLATSSVPVLEKPFAVSELRRLLEARVRA